MKKITQINHKSDTNNVCHLSSVSVCSDAEHTVCPLNGVYGDATNLVTNVKFGMQIMMEYKATLYGYALFGTANAVNQVLMFNGDFYSDASKTVGKARHRFAKNIDNGIDGLEKSRNKLNREITRQIKPPSILKTAFKIRVRL